MERRDLEIRVIDKGDITAFQADGVLIGAAVGDDTTAAIVGTFGKKDLIKALAGIKHQIYNHLGEDEAREIFVLADLVADAAFKEGTK